ncbi:MAG: hypothetical protein EOM53_04550 [Alphaproteobacteria bacterium]|nr:hypothetical protein [Alphaproteobacteria bacterium]
MDETRQKNLSFNAHYALDVISQIPGGEDFFKTLPDNIKIKCMEKESLKLAECVFCDKEYQILFNQKFSYELFEEEYEDFVILLGHYLKKVSLMDENRKQSPSKEIKEELENFDIHFAEDLLGTYEGLAKLESLKIMEEDQEIVLRSLENRLLSNKRQKER